MYADVCDGQGSSLPSWLLRGYSDYFFTTTTKQLQIRLTDQMTFPSSELMFKLSKWSPRGALPVLVVEEKEEELT